MDPLNLAWSAAGIAGAVAFGLLVRVSGEGRRTSSLRSDLAEARKQLRGGRKHEEQRSKALRNSDAEIGKIERQLSRSRSQADRLRLSKAGEITRAQDGGRYAGDSYKSP